MKRSVVYDVVRAVCMPIGWVFRLSALHRERVPSDGPLIVVSNHESIIDPVMMGLCFRGRQMNYMAKSELFKNRLLGGFFRQMRVFPIKRGTPDRGAIAEATKRLEAGGVLGIFPEGTRHHEGMGEAHGGAAFLAVRTNATVLPTAIIGTDRIRPDGKGPLRFPRITVVYGKPIAPDPSLDGKQQVQALTQALMEGIAAAAAEAGTQGAEA